MEALKVELFINQKIEILDNNMTYKSNIQDIKDNYLLIDVPIAGTRYFMMHVGTLIEFYVSTSKLVYKCSSIVLGKKEENNITLIILSLPKVLEKVQRREFFRLPISMNANYFILPENRRYFNLKDIPTGYFNSMSKTITIDISGGGIKIVTKEAVVKNRNILISISIPEEINLLCSVVRVEYNTFEKNYKISLRYEGIDERIRDRIIKFIFDKLRDQSKLLK